MSYDHWMKKRQRLEQARVKHDKFLAKYGLTAKRKSKRQLSGEWPEDQLYRRQPQLSDVSNQFANAGFLDDPMAHVWKTGREESTETLLEIEKKRQRAAPMWNKGGYQYITPGSDTKTLGKKV